MELTELNYEYKFKTEEAVLVHVLQTTQNLVISRCRFAEDGKETYKELSASAQPLFCALNHLLKAAAH